MDLKGQQLVEALCALEGNPYWEFYRTCIENELEIAKNEMIGCSETLELRWLQGRAQTLADISSQIEQARNDMQKIREKKARTSAAGQQRGTPNTPFRP
jgi:hypothetical protein